MNKRFVIVLAACVAVFVGLVLFNKREASAPDANKDNQSGQLSSHVVGTGTTGVTLTEYGDFQCPACFQYYPLVKQVKEKYGDRIKFQFRHFPLSEIHQNAIIAARAAEAAGLQGRFFEMHDKLYENQKTWEATTNPGQIFEDYASQLALNVDKFRTDMKSEQTNRTVQADRSEAKRLGYSSTPTFEINGAQVEPPRDLQSFYKLIDDAIANKQTPQNETSD
jgi:protein-disulfide isomerase